MLNGNGKVYLGDTEIDLDTQIELAEHSLKVAINHLNDLLAKRNALEAHIDAEADRLYQEHLDTKFGKACIESDAHDAEVRRC